VILKVVEIPHPAVDDRGAMLICYSRRSDPPNADRPFLKTPVFPAGVFSCGKSD
jgi:hypothetical protein